MVLSVLLAPVTLVLSWTQDTLVDTDTWVQRSHDLLSDQQVRDSLARTLSNEVVDAIESRTAVSSALEGLLADDRIPQGIRDSIKQSTDSGREKVRTGVRTVVANVISGPAFSTAWDQANRELHQQLVAQLDADTAASQPLRLDLGQATAVVLDELAGSGFPDVRLSGKLSWTYSVASAESLDTARTGWKVMNTVAPVLPWLTGLLVVAGLVMSRSRLRTAGWAALSAAALVALTIPIAKLVIELVADQVAHGRLATVIEAAGAAVSDPLVHRLTSWSLVLGAVGVLAFVGSVVGARKGAAGSS